MKGTLYNEADASRSRMWSSGCGVDGGSWMSRARFLRMEHKIQTGFGHLQNIT